MGERGVVVVTGAAGSLGAAVARRARADGAALLLLDLARSSERLGALAAELGDAVAYTGDLATAAGWDEALASATALGPVTGAALIAGGWAGGPPLHAGGDDGWQRMMAVNADTVHLALRALLPGMVERGRGSVVVVGARQVERPWIGGGQAAYVASKAAAVALAQVAAAEVLEAGVRVNAVLPSVLDTPPNRSAMPDADPSRWVGLDSLAGVVGFLLSDAARDVSGAAIPVYGRA